MYLTLLKTSITIFSVFIFSFCTSTKNTSNDTINSNDTKLEVAKMMENGFKKGVIVASDKEGDCPYTIQLEDDNYKYFLDPINITEDFKKDGEKIWVKFAGLRMMNRCEKANPVSIIEMHVREE